MTLICDTGPIYAALNRRDTNHQRCRDLLLDDPGPLVVPSPVLVEVCWLLESRMGAEAEAAFLESIAAEELVLAELANADLVRMAELVRRYGDFPLGAADASVIAVAERLGTARVATLDRRHFLAVVPAHADAFVVLP